MADEVIEYRHPRDRGLRTVYATLRDGEIGVVAATGAAAQLTESGWPTFAIPMTDDDVPYLYRALPPAGLAVKDYELGISQAPDADPVVYSISDRLIAQGVFAWRGVQGSVAPGSGTAALKTEIVTTLGANTLDVELTDADLSKCLSDAVRVLNREKPPTAWGVANVGSARTNSIPVSAPGLYGIIDVDWSGARANCGVPCDPFAYDDPALRYRLVAGGLTGQIGDLVQQQQYLIQTAEVTGRNTDWETRWVRNADGTSTLYLMLSDMPPGASVMYEYAWHLTADDDPSTGVANVPPNDLDWLVKYATARAKQILGRVLRKYGGGVNMPDGGTEQLDGNELMQEGQNEQQTLEQQMHERRRPIVPRIG